MAAISVITPSIRPKGLDLVKKALDRQTNEDYEWLVNDKKYNGGFWGLNRAYNDLIRRSIGELLVSWQDYTFADPGALDKFWDCYKKTNGVISGVGNKYTDDSWTEAIWKDPRQRSDQGTFYPCTPRDIEWNFCAVPKEAVLSVGGFDEEMDFLGYGMDGISINERMFDVGWETYLDQSNVSYSLPHKRVKGWDKHNLLGEGYNKRKSGLIKSGGWPKLNYLD